MTALSVMLLQSLKLTYAYPTLQRFLEIKSSLSLRSKQRTTRKLFHKKKKIAYAFPCLHGIAQSSSGTTNRDEITRSNEPTNRQKDGDNHVRRGAGDGGGGPPGSDGLVSVLRGGRPPPGAGGRGHALPGAVAVHPSSPAPRAVPLRPAAAGRRGEALRSAAGDGADPGRRPRRRVASLDPRAPDRLEEGGGDRRWTASEGCG